MLRKYVMKNWFYTIVFCILSIMGFFAVYVITQGLLVYMGTEQRLAETFGRFVSSIGILLLYNQMFDIKTFGLKREGFWKGIITGGFLFVVIMANAVLLLTDLSEYPVVIPPVYFIVIVFMEQVFVGIFEEFLFRGFILNTLLEKMKGNQLKNKLTAVAISSVLFGVMHFMNLIDNPDKALSVFVDVCCATCTGMFYGVLYLRCKNIWTVVFYHALLDLASDFLIIFYQLPVSMDVNLSLVDAVPNILSNTVFIFVALFLARKLKE